MSALAPDTDRPEQPAGLRYRLITGPDDAEFCRRVSDALESGYVLHGSPAIAFNGATVIAAQAVVRPEAGR